jgi:phosphoserine phosphatase RsbU/P
VINFILHHFSKHKLAFFFFTFAGFIYFFFATIVFGLNSNIHYYFLVMCMISAVIFDNNWVINGFISLAILSFFSLIYLMHDNHGLIIDSPELIEVQTIVGYVVVFLLFIIACVFFIFLKTENSNYQKEILSQKEIIEQAHKEITDSINYAERLQRSLMSSKKLLDENLENYFVYFNPKEAVSGDFYWSAVLSNKNVALVCAYSTGHGVPGAIMSMMNMNSLKEAVKEGCLASDEILNHTRSTIIETLANDGSTEGGKDGMDAALIIFNPDKSELEFSLANNPLWIIRGGELLEFKADKMPVGRHDKQDTLFTRHSEKLQKEDLIYIFTDGFADQFGGEKGKKFKYASLKELLLSIADKPMEEQKTILSKTFENWRGSLEQVDDVCIVGVRV